MFVSLAAQAMACRRGRRMLFRGLDLRIVPGNITWLRGANGSGKTSLMRILAGLSHAAEGQVLWNDQPLAKQAAAARHGTIYIGHANALKDDLTLTEALAFLASLAGLDRGMERARHALDVLGLASRRDALVRTLSQGQRRRGALARLALDDAPRCWILDEPFDALDAASVERLSAIVSDHARRGGAVLLTSHQDVRVDGMRPFELQPLRDAA